MTTKIKPEATSEPETDAADQPTTQPTTQGETTAHDPAALRQRRESLGVSRRALSQLAQLSESRCWAAEQPGKEVSAEHLALIGSCLDAVQENGLPADLNLVRQSRRSEAEARLSEALNRLTAIMDVLDQAVQAKTVKDMRTLVEQARTLAAVGGSVGGSVGEQRPEESKES